MTDKQTVDEILGDLEFGLSWAESEGALDDGEAVKMVKKHREALNQLLIKAELKGFLTGYDCHDYPRLREYKAHLENQLGEKS